jgi:ABC-type uncharacterized transport system ATPase subunit
MTDQDIKREIRQLKKLKLKCRTGSKERIDLYRQIKDLKKQLTDITIVEPEKIEIITEILKHEKISIFDEQYYNKFSVKELKFYLKKLKERIKK